MGNELYNALKKINIKLLDDLEKSELLKIFLITENQLVRNHIAFIFSDIDYNAAVPFIIKRIENKDTYNANGSLVYALKNLDTKKYFLSFIKMIYQQGYEARLAAYEIIQKDIQDVEYMTKKRAIGILRKYKRLEKDRNLMDENGILHFVEETEMLIKDSL